MSPGNIMPGEWRTIDDPAYRVEKWDQERYWFFYLCFGRLGFNRETNPEVWRREFRLRFGKAAPAIEQAYRAASEVLPMITAARLPGASEWSWWPEMDTGGNLREYMHIQPSDTAQFYAIQTWKRTPRWRCEAWDATVRGYVEDAVEGRLRGKRTPIEVSRRFRELSEQTLKRLIRGRARARHVRLLADETVSTEDLFELRTAATAVV